ncbi:putative cupredoxin [Tanacetum coccineum]
MEDSYRALHYVGDQLDGPPLDNIDYSNGPATKNLLNMEIPSCNVSAPISTHSTGNDSITITNYGHHFYLCAVPGHCQAGQKVDINVQRVSSTLAPTPSASDPLPSPSMSSPSLPPTSATVNTPNSVGKAASATLSLIKLGMAIAVFVVSCNPYELRLKNKSGNRKNIEPNANVLTFKALEDCISLVRHQVPTRDGIDSWQWMLEDGGFTVKVLKEMVDEKILGPRSQVEETKWCRIVPRKVNVFMWRLKCGRIPVRTLLDNIGMDLHSTLCPHCGEAIKTKDHNVLNFVGFGSSKLHLYWEAVIWTSLYLIWKAQNNKVFRDKEMSAVDLVFEIQLTSFFWVS